MPRRLRFVPPGGSLVEVTTRTVQGRYLLRPSPHLNKIIVGILARARERFPVRLHGAVFLSNHYHLLLWAQDAGQLAGFMHYLNGNLAREIRRLHDWPDRVWSRRYQATLVTDEGAAQVARLRYLLAHGAKEGLVASPLDWPGVHSAKALTTGKALHGVWVNRTLESDAVRAGKKLDTAACRETYTLSFEALPCWKELSEPEVAFRVSDLIEQIESEAARLLELQGAEVVGPTRVLSQDPQTRPNRLKKSPAPFVHAASKAARELSREAYRAFFAAYRLAAQSLGAAKLDTPFPEGSFPGGLPFVSPDLPLPAT